MQAIVITNQRETVIAWNALTGVMYYNVFVLDYLRTTFIAKSIANRDLDRLRKQTGLLLTSYLAATKMRWLLEDMDEGGERDNIGLSTIDSWLVYQLTGSHTHTTTPSTAENTGGKFLTDPTNASRWILLDLHTLTWSPSLLRTIFHSSPCASLAKTIPIATALPQIRPSSHVFGACTPKFGVQELEGQRSVGC